MVFDWGRKSSILMQQAVRPKLATTLDSPSHTGLRQPPQYPELQFLGFWFSFLQAFVDIMVKMGLSVCCCPHVRQSRMEVEPLS